MSKYIPVIGLEVHCELKSNSKNFSTGKNGNGDVNTNLSVVDIGYPGILPCVNKEAVKKSIMVALALNSTVPEKLTFDRKNYYYPDLPKGYQITQFHNPIGTNGFVMINVDGVHKKIDIHDTHLEEDTANMDHLSTYSLIDYNRACVPLLETVSEPCISSSKEAIAYLEALRNIFLYLDASDARADLGQIRVDVNVSMKKEEDTELGTRVEMKNINSFSTVKEVIEVEIKRQTEILEAGGIIKQETRRYDETTNTTIRMRKKEGSIDYKYFVEPNIPRIKIDPKWLEEIKSEIPTLPNERLKTYMEKYGLSEYDGKILVRNKDISDYFNKCLFLGINPKIASNWITTEVMSVINKESINIKDLFLTPERLLQIVRALEANTISSKQAKELFALTLKENAEPNALIEKYGMKQLDNDDELEVIIKNILDNNASQIEAYWNGKTNMFNYFVGQTMKETRGKANPVKAKEIISRELDARK